VILPYETNFLLKSVDMRMLKKQKAGKIEEKRMN